MLNHFTKKADENRKVEIKAVHSSNSFGIRYIFGKMYRLLQNKKSEISGTFSTLVKRPKIMSTVEQSETFGMIFEIFDHYLD